MTPEQNRLALVLAMLACSGLLLFNPVEVKVSAEIIFDDPVDKRIEEESIGETLRSQLVLRFRHDEGGRLTNNLSRVQALMQLEQEALDGSNPATAWEGGSTIIQRIETPFKRWSEAFESRNRSLSDASSFGDVLQPTISEGWCGNGSTDAEQSAFEATLLMLPGDTEFGVACPAFAGSSADLAPASNEILWMVWLDDPEGDADWGALSEWAEKLSDSTEFEVSAVGVNMLFAKSKDIALDDLRVMLVPAILILVLILSIGLRDPRVAVATIGGIGLVIGAEMGALSTLGFEFSILDVVAIPIIMGVAVDGAFWYCRSSRDRDQVRRMLFLAMLTTVGAVSLALFSPIRAHRSLGMVMVIGIFLDWVLTRFVLEEFYLRRRSMQETKLQRGIQAPNRALSWCWPVALLLLASIALIAPSGVEILDVKQFLPADDSALDEMEGLQSRYVLASSTIAWVIVDVDGGSSDDLQQIRDLQRQLSTHPSTISFDTGMFRTPMVIGVPYDDEGLTDPTIDTVSQASEGSMLMEDARLQRDGVTTGVAIAVMIDGQDADSALLFTDDVEALLDDHELDGTVGGDLPVGARLAHSFEQGRIAQIVLAGSVIFIIALAVLHSPLGAARIAVGTIAIGAAVDGLASIIGGRQINTALAVLLGMGFTADYLSHSSVGHSPTRRDASARWWAALSSISIFALLALGTFPPSKHMGELLTISILLSVILATCLSWKHFDSEATEQE